jgi:hypothetical protein
MRRGDGAKLGEGDQTCEEDTGEVSAESRNDGSQPNDTDKKGDDGVQAVDLRGMQLVK